MYADLSHGASSSSSSLDGGVTLPNYPNLSARVASRFHVSVTDPEQRGEGLTTHIAYKINSTLEYDDGLADPVVQSCVIRRFRDFESLAESLANELPGLLIPALPEKALMGRFDATFVEERRRALQLFLVRLLEHNMLRRHAHVHLFLTGSESALAAVRAKQKDANKQSTSKSLLSFWNSSVALVSNTLGSQKDYDKSEDDVVCERMLAYTLQVQTELSLLESQVEGWLTKEQGLCRAAGSMGVSSSMLSQAEGQPRAPGGRADGSSVEYVPPPQPSSATSSSFTSIDAALGLGGDPGLARLLGMLGASFDQMAMLLQKKEAEESLEFREPLKDAYRTAQAVESMLRRRASCLSEYHQLLSAVDGARAKLITAQGTPGKEGRIPALEQAVGNAESAASAKQHELAQMTAATRMEFQRSQQEKNAALSQIVRTFIRLQLDHSNKVSQVWQSVLNVALDESS